MEENTARVTEIEEIDDVNEVIETSEDSSAGAFVAGIVGGFLAYAVVGGAKKLWAFAAAKWEARKQKEASNVIVDAEIVESEPEQNDSEEEDQSK